MESYYINWDTSDTKVANTISTIDALDSYYYGLINQTHWIYKWQRPSELPTQVFFNKKKKATTLLFNGKPYVVKCDSKDKYDKRIGFLEAYFQAQSGLSKTQANKYLRDIVKEDN